MTEPLTTEGYEHTLEKLRDLKSRLAEIDGRTDLTPSHRVSVRQSYNMMIREYMKDIKLYEARRARETPPASAWRLLRTCCTIVY